MIRHLRQFLFVYLLLTLLVILPATAQEDVFVSPGEPPVSSLFSATHPFFSYGPVSISTTALPLDRLELSPPAGSDVMLANETLLDKVTMVNVAEAAAEPVDKVVQDFMANYGRLKSAANLQQVSDVVAEDSMQSLQEKLAAGINEVVVVEMLKSMFPDMELEVYDAAVAPAEAVLAVRDARHRTDVQGIILLKKETNTWKIRQVQWLESPTYTVKPGPMDLVPSSLLMSYAEGVEPDSMKAQWEHSDYILDQNILSLKRLSQKFTKSAFVFVFVVERKKKPVIEADDASFKKNTSSQLHILWTGPRQLLPQPRVYSDLRLPLDVSVAHYKQGYKSNALNLRLPRRRPKEVTFVIWCKF